MSLSKASSQQLKSHQLSVLLRAGDRCIKQTPRVKQLAQGRTGETPCRLTQSPRSEAPFCLRPTHQISKLLSE